MKKFFTFIAAALSMMALNATVPANPVIGTWNDCGDESGYSYLTYTLPTVDVDGNPLNMENLTYSIFVDNGNGPEIFVFKASDYTYDLYTDQTEIFNWVYTNGVDFHVDYTFFYRTNASGYTPLFTENIGIQVYYYEGGVKTASEIVWLYEVTPPAPYGVPTAAPTFNGYTEDGIHAYFVEIKPTEPSTIYYRVQFPDGTWTEWAEYTEILSFTGNGKYRVEAYAVAPEKDPSTEIAYEFVVSPFTGIEEMNADKAVAGVRYFNMAGQEMQQANGMTIVVTTYTDGTTSTAKVVK